MARTNFANMLDNEKVVWSREAWSIARNASFVMRFAGTSDNAMITRITELTKTERGTKAIFFLVADLVGDGVTGDYKLEDNEEAMRAWDQEVRIDQLRNAVRNTGRFNDQKTVIKFREQARDKLGYWLADRIDQLGFLTLSGVAYTERNRGGARPVKAAGQNFSDLEFAADVTAPTEGRHFMLNDDGDLVPADTTAITTGNRLTYASLVKAHAFAKDSYIRGIRVGGGAESLYHVFVTPTVMAQLRLDPDFLANVRHAGVRGESNPLFKGVDSVMLDGMIVHQYHHVYRTDGMAAGEKWGAEGTVEGCRVLICGSQALGMADLGVPYWVEDGFDYENNHGISIAKMFGFKKPVFYSDVTERDEDFGVMCLDVATGGTDPVAG